MKFHRGNGTEMPKTVENFVFIIHWAILPETEKYGFLGKKMLFFPKSQKNVFFEIIG